MQHQTFELAYYQLERSQRGWRLWSRLSWTYTGSTWADGETVQAFRDFLTLARKCLYQALNTLMVFYVVQVMQMRAPGLLVPLMLLMRIMSVLTRFLMAQMAQMSFQALHLALTYLAAQTFLMAFLVIFPEARVMQMRLQMSVCFVLQVRFMKLFLGSMTSILVFRRFHMAQEFFTTLFMAV